MRCTFLAPVTLLATLTLAQDDTPAATDQLPTVQLYFQCGDIFNRNQDLNDIHWDQVLQGYYQSVLIDAATVKVADFVSVRDRRCADNDEKQFRINVMGATAEYAPRSIAPSSSAPSTTDIATVLADHMEELEDALSEACYGDELDAFQYRVGEPNDAEEEEANGPVNSLGDDSWNSRICSNERVNDQGAVGSALTTLGIIGIAVGGFLFLLALGCCCCCFLL